MTRSTTRILWLLVFAILIAFAIPWFLWRSDTVIASLPLWVWWHIGWMGIAAVLFRLFSVTAWGLWIEEGA